MKIVNLATTDMFGAGIAAQFLNQTFNEQGCESVLIVKETKLENKNVIPLNKYHSKFELKYLKNKLLEGYLFHWLALKLNIFKNKFYFLNLFENKEIVSAQTIIKTIPFKPDVIVLHWISGFINMKTVSKIQQLTQAKLFWVMMDNAPITGGCHYPWDCNGFHSNCSNCKAINCSIFKNIALKNYNLKKTFLPENMTLLCCSENDYQRANKSSLFKNEMLKKVILPVNHQIFNNQNKLESKQKLNIPITKKIIFYGSISVSDERKGFSHFVSAINIIDVISKEKKHNCEDYIIVVAGKTDKKILDLIKLPVLSLGYLNEIDLANAYNAADVFVSSSLEDSGPYMINQSISCGTPVVSFEMGVALDLVIHKQTGYLASKFDSNEMAKGIDYILSLEKQEYEVMSKNCVDLGKKICGNFATSFLIN